MRTNPYPGVPTGSGGVRTAEQKETFLHEREDYNKETVHEKTHTGAAKHHKLAVVQIITFNPLFDCRP